MSPLKITFDGQKLLESATAEDVFSIIGAPLLSVNSLNLHEKRSRIDADHMKDMSSEKIDWLILRSGGVYAVELDNGLYFGSTGGGGNYFNRRFKQHLADIGNLEKHKGNKYYAAARESSSVTFHVMARTETASEARFLEYSCIHWASVFAPHILINDEDSYSDNRERNKNSEISAQSQMKIKALVNRKKITLARKLH